MDEKDRHWHYDRLGSIDSLNMKHILAVALLLMSALVVLGQGPVQRNFFSTNVNPQAIADYLKFTVSSKGIINGQSTIKNNGANFGPDTTATTTSGLQEALDAVSYIANGGPTVGGVTLVAVDNAYYFFTNALVLSNYFPRGITIRGQNMESTKLVYAGPTTVEDTILFRGAGTPRANSLNLPVHLTITDMGFSAITNSTNVLLHIQNYSYASLYRVNFTGWQVMTNQVDGASMSTDLNSVSGVTGASLVGLKLTDGPDHGTTIIDSYFAGLATGIDARNDHIRAFGTTFAHIGIFTNSWPATSRYSLGACIVRDGGLDDMWSYCHFYSANAGFVLLDSSLNSPYIYHAHFESVQNPVSTLRDNTRTPILIDPVPFDNTWSGGNVHSLMVSNSPNYGFIGLFHTNSVTYGVDSYAAAAGDGDSFTVYRGGSELLNVRNGGTDIAVSAFIDGGANVIDLNPATGLLVGDAGFNDYVSIYASGDIEWTGTGHGNGGGISNSVDLIAAAGITIVTNANNRSFTLSAGAGSITLTNTTGFPGVLVGSSGSFGIGTNLSGNGAGFTNIPTILIAGTNIVILTNNGAGGRFTYTIHGTATGSGGDGFWVESDLANLWTNLFGGYYQGDYENLLKIGTNVMGSQIGEGGSTWFGGGLRIDMLTNPNTYWIGNTGSSAEGSFSLSDGDVNSIDVATDVDVTGDVNVSGGIFRHADGFTNRVAVWGANGNLTNGDSQTFAGAVHTNVMSIAARFGNDLSVTNSGVGTLISSNSIYTSVITAGGGSFTVVGNGNTATANLNAGSGSLFVQDSASVGAQIFTSYPLRWASRAMLFSTNASTVLVAADGASIGAISGDLKAKVLTGQNAVALATNSPSLWTPVVGHVILVTSNYDLYMVTPIRTNLISAGN